MTSEQHNELLIELRAIRAALETKPRAVATAPSVASSTPLPITLPAPEVWVDNAGDVTVHFGKNAGTPVSQLSDAQLRYYGADREQNLRKDGTPFPPREADTLLKNAARTIWHSRREPAPQIAEKAPSKPSDTEEVPF
jgi:hypothetical protein